MTLDELQQVHKTASPNWREADNVEKALVSDDKPMNSLLCKDIDGYYIFDWAHDLKAACVGRNLLGEVIALAHAAQLAVDTHEMDSSPHYKHNLKMMLKAFNQKLREQ